jgi:hypothetical protein
VVGTERVQTNGKVPIAAAIVDGSREKLSGLTDLKLYVVRLSDHYQLDWSDQTFKDPTTISAVNRLLNIYELDATSDPGFYQINTLDHPGGLFDFSKPTNKATGDTYRFHLIQDSTPQSAANTPQIGEVIEGDWLDFIDQAISDNASPTEVKAELVGLGLDHLVSVNPGIVPPAAGTYIRQILDRLDRKPEYAVLQNYSYSPTEDKIRGSVWVEHRNIVLIDAGATVLVQWIDAETDAVLWSVADTDVAPDARGFFYIEKDTPGLTQNRAYYALATVTLTDSTVLKGGKGSFTF